MSTYINGHHGYYLDITFVDQDDVLICRLKAPDWADWKERKLFFESSRGSGRMTSPIVALQKLHRRRTCDWLEMEDHSFRRGDH